MCEGSFALLLLAFVGLCVRWFWLLDCCGGLDRSCYRLFEFAFVLWIYGDVLVVLIGYCEDVWVVFGLVVVLMKLLLVAIV